MPQIIVTSNPAKRGQNGKVTHRERVDAADFKSAHFRAQLLQRLGWAIGDAHAVECPQPPRRNTANDRDSVAAPPTPQTAARTQR